MLVPSRLPRPTPGQSFESTTGEMSQSMLESLNRKATMATSDLAPLPRPSAPEISVEPGTSPGLPAAPAGPPDREPGASDFAVESSAIVSEAAEPSPASTMPGHTPAPALRDSQPGTSQPRITPPAPSLAPPPIAAPMARSTPPAVVLPNAPVEKKSALPKALLAILLLGGLGAGGYYVYTTQFAKKPTDVAAGPGSEKPKTGSAGSAVVAVSKPDAAAIAESPKDAAQVATATPDAAAQVPAATPDAATQVASATPDAAASNSANNSNNDNSTNNVATPSGASDQLEIASSPKGARIFIDGADQGTAPLKIPGSTDRHSFAAFVPGHDLYLAEIDGHGVFNIELKPIEKGPKVFGGIKVLKCKPNRYYVYVDGKPTGQLCPTERILTSVGPHTVEVYDLVSESRRKFNITVKDQNASERVRLE
jgi:hypothetical protein